ncbi:MAG: ATP-binding cassette domain-containing protein [Armatimonadetes bacterium]|nr:ATP-binding cassette domain-containing protein [Armatimonadota bacterium]
MRNSLPEAGKLRLSGVTKKIGGFSLQDISLEVAPGEYFVVLGPTGAGKTVLLETVAGIHSVDAGEIWFDGVNITAWPPEQRRFGFVYQDYVLFPHLNVKQNIAFGARVNRWSKNGLEKKIEDIAALLGISHLLRRFPGTLSGGEQQRVALARALVTEPQILLLDEPLAALDPRNREALQQELRQLHKIAGTLTLQVTHDFEEAFFLADRIAVLDGGRLLQVGPPEEIFARPRSAAAARFVGAENIFTGEIICRDGKKFVRLDGALLEVNTGLSGPVGFSVRPEDILLNNSPQPGNCLRGKILICCEGVILQGND